MKEKRGGVIIKSDRKLYVKKNGKGSITEVPLFAGMREGRRRGIIIKVC